MTTGTAASEQLPAPRVRFAWVPSVAAPVRNSLAPRALAFLVPLSVLYAGSKDEIWATSWLAASSHVAMVSILLGPAGSALAAWDVAKWRRRRIAAVEDAAARAAWRIYAGRLITVAACIAVCYGLAAARVASLMPFAEGGLSIPALAVGMTALLMHIALGGLCGAVLPSAAGPPVAFVLSYAWVALLPLALDFGPASNLAAYPEVCCGFDTTLAADFLSWQFLWLIGLVALFVGVALSRRQGRGAARGCAALILVGIVGASVGGVRTASYEAGGVAPRPPPADPRCAQERGVSLCVWPEQVAAARPGVEALSALHSELVDVADLGLPTAFSASGAVVRPGVTQLSLPNGRPSQRELEAVWAESVLPPRPACNGRSRSGIARPIVVAYLLDQLENGSGGVAALGPALGPELDAALRLAPSGRRTWLRGLLIAMRACDAEPPFLVLRPS